MNKDDLIRIVDLRTVLIKIWTDLPGKNEPSSLVKSQDVAQQIGMCIKKIDKILEGKVNFSSGENQ